MEAIIYRKIVSGEFLLKLFKIPKINTKKEFEIIIKPVSKKKFESLKLIKLDTKNFKFSRELANER
ncbi:MAG: hypothetical protein KAT68_16430 [Bacteroidales bacterium]|nr:hypothetical protein [Bacteroidales bacterium]